MAIPTGADSYIQYGWESTYGTETVAYDKVFGRNVTFTPSLDNNMLQVMELNSQDPSAQIPLAFGGTFNVAFTAANFYWLKAIVGDPVDAGGGPYTHTYTYQNTPSAFSIEDGMNLDTDSARAYLGCFANTASINANVGETIKGSIAGAYSTEAEDSSLDGTPASEAEAPFTFAQATLEFPNATTIDNVQSVGLTFNRNAEGVPAIGSRFLQDRIYKGRWIDFTVTVPLKDAATFLETAYGSATAPAGTVAEVASIELNITNGGAGTALRSLAILGTNAFVKTYNTSRVPLERVDEEIAISVRGLSSCTYTDNTAVAL